VRSIPADRLLLESDCPDGAVSLAPGSGWREAVPGLIEPPAGRATTPAVVGSVLRLVAAAAGRDERQVAAETWDNACRVFGLPPVGGGSGQEFRSGATV
jgi:TatD DNase family protein